MRLRNHVLTAAMVAGLLATTIGGASASFQGQDTVSFVRYDGADTRIFEMRPNGTEEHKVFGPTKGSFVYASAMAPDRRRTCCSRASPPTGSGCSSPPPEGRPFAVTGTTTS